MLNMSPGEYVGLTATTLLSDGYTPVNLSQQAVWTSTNPSVATVTVNDRWVNNHPTARVNALSIGMTAITVQVGSLVSSVIINVQAEESASSIEITAGDIVDPENDNPVIHPSPPKGILGEDN